MGARWRSAGHRTESAARRFYTVSYVLAHSEASGATISGPDILWYDGVGFARYFVTFTVVLLTWCKVHTGTWSLPSRYLGT